MPYEKSLKYHLMKKSIIIQKFLLIALLPFLIMLASCSVSTQKSPEEKNMVAWYNKPADQVWHDGLLIGNGYMGANVFGRVQNERIALNESTFWSGRPHDHNDPDAYKYFDQIKELVFAEKYQGSGDTWQMNTSMENLRHFRHMRLLEIFFWNFKVTGDSISDYYRELDMETGIVKVRYTDGRCEDDPRSIYVLS